MTTMENKGTYKKLKTEIELLLPSVKHLHWHKDLVVIFSILKKNIARHHVFQFAHHTFARWERESFWKINFQLIGESCTVNIKMNLR